MRQPNQGINAVALLGLTACLAMARNAAAYGAHVDQGNMMRTEPRPAALQQVKANVDSAGPHIDLHQASLKEEVSLTQVCKLCSIMYGTIGALWVVYMRAPKGDNTARIYIALLCATWASTSVGMHVLNKGLATKLKAPALISAAQMIIAVGIVGGMSYKRLVEAPRRQLFIWLIVPVFFSAMLCTSIYSYEYISLSLLTVVRNLTPLVVLPIETMVMPVGKQPQVTLMVVGSILIMLAGAIIYGGGMKDISLLGIAFAVVNMFLAASDRLIQRRLLTEECKDLHASVCTTMNNALGLLPTLILACATHQVSDLTKPEQQEMWSDPAAWFLLVLSGCVGIGICYLGFECQRVISATSFFVLQNMSKVFVVGAGILVFHDPIRSVSQVAGLCMSLGGSFMYGKTQMDMAAEQQRLKASAAESLDTSESQETKAA